MALAAADTSRIVSSRVILNTWRTGGVRLNRVSFGRTNFSSLFTSGPSTPGTTRCGHLLRRRAWVVVDRIAAASPGGARNQQTRYRIPDSPPRPNVQVQQRGRRQRLRVTERRDGGPSAATVGQAWNP